MYNVYRCFQDYNETFEYLIASFVDMQKAEKFAEAEERSDGCLGVYYTVRLEI